MGTLNVIMDGVVGFFQGFGVIVAVMLAALTWPVLTATTKWLVLSAILATIVNDFILYDREFDVLTATLGIGGSAVIMGVS